MSRLPASSGGTLIATGLTKSHGGLTVLDSVSLTVSSGTRLGVVGPNGAGKTTLLRILAGLTQPDGGSVEKAPPDLQVGYLPQEKTVPGNETLGSFLARRAGVAAAQSDLERTAEALATGEAGADDAYAGALHRYLILGGADFDARAAAVCDDLDLAPASLGRPMQTLSGGQRARAALASILISRFDVFLLDEPTNDLDFAGLARLEEFLERLQRGVVLVSHDRAFLDQTIERILEIDEHTHRAVEFGGGWAGYLEARAAARRRTEQAHLQYEAERDRLEIRARTVRQWASSGARRTRRRHRDNDKLQRDWQINRTQRAATRVRAIESAVEQLDAPEKPWEGWYLRLELQAGAPGGDIVARLTGAVVELGAFRLGPIDLEITRGERVAILGPNGSGKTTLLRALIGDISLTRGQRYLGPSVLIGHIDQERQLFLGAEPLLAAFRRASGLPAEPARSLLAKFGLGPQHVNRAPATLSPGERTRALLGLLAARGVNCLILDEPTNHLDLPAIEQLEQALEHYSGTLLLVTHDRRLLEAVRLDRTLELGR